MAQRPSEGDSQKDHTPDQAYNAPHDLKACRHTDCVFRLIYPVDHLIRVTHAVYETAPNVGSDRRQNGTSVRHDAAIVRLASGRRSHGADSTAGPLQPGEAFTDEGERMPWRLLIGLTLLGVGLALDAWGVHHWWPNQRVSFKTRVAPTFWKGFCITLPGYLGAILASEALAIPAPTVVLALTPILALVVGMMITRRVHNRGLPPTSATTPPGWYPDPGGGSGTRWWDGHAWQLDGTPAP